MSPQSLAIVFSPSLLKPPPGPGEYGRMMANLGHAAALVKVSSPSLTFLLIDDESVTSGREKIRSDDPCPLSLPL